MSGTAALAAARKRRANPQPNVSNSIMNSNTNSNINSNMNSNQKLGSNSNENDTEFPKATNPAMLLMQHNILIQRLQKEVLELKAETKDLKPKTNETGLDYKTEYLGLLEEMKEMKKVLLKVQSFSMETNLEVMKLKRISESKQNETEKIDLSSITVTNDIDNLIV
jgi:hypothetical protein